MKTIQNVVLFLSLLCSTALPQGPALTRENTVIACDIDKVALNLPKSQWPKIALKCAQLIRTPQDIIDVPKTLYFTYKAFCKKTNGIKGIHDAQGNAVDGLTAQMLIIGMRHKEATRFIAPFLEIVEPLRQRDEEIITILKATNLPIVWATNKDTLTYQAAAQIHGLNTIASKAIVTKQPLSKEVIEFAHRDDTPESYRQLAEKYDNDQTTDMIIHAPGKKPDLEYFEHVEKTIGPEKNIIFIDDKKNNIAGFNKLQSSHAAQRIGIQHKGEPTQLINAFVKLGIL